jgi:hypothetical protein
LKVSSKDFRVLEGIGAAVIYVDNNCVEEHQEGLGFKV